MILTSAEESKGFEDLLLIILSWTGRIFEVIVHISDTGFIFFFFWFHEKWPKQLPLYQSPSYEITDPEYSEPPLKPQALPLKTNKQKLKSNKQKLKTNSRQRSTPRQSHNPGWHFYLASCFLSTSCPSAETPRGLGCREFTGTPVQLPYSWLGTRHGPPAKNSISHVGRQRRGSGAGKSCSSSMFASWLGLVQRSGIIIGRLTKHNGFRAIPAWPSPPMSILSLCFRGVLLISSVSPELTSHYAAKVEVDRYWVSIRTFLFPFII